MGCGVASFEVYNVAFRATGHRVASWSAMIRGRSRRLIKLAFLSTFEPYSQHVSAERYKRTIADVRLGDFYSGWLEYFCARAQAFSPKVCTAMEVCVLM